MKLSHILTLAAITAGFTSASADDLTKEITIQKDIVPQERDANRIGQLPRLSLPEITLKKLQWTDRAVSAPLSTSLSVLSPAPYLSTLDRYPYKGYIDLGYFPTFQAGLSAGYRFIDNDNTISGVWLQYDGSQYKRENIFDRKETYKNHAATIGWDYSHRFEEAGTFSASLGYSFHSFNFPNVSGDTENPDDYSFNQNVNRFNAKLGWDGNAGKLSYYARAGYRFFGFSKSSILPSVANEKVNPMKENSLSLDLGALYDFDGKNGIGLDLGIVNNSYSDYGLLSMTGNDNSDYRFVMLPQDNTQNFGHYSVKPYYQRQSSNFRIKAGLELSHRWALGGATQAGIDLELAWAPSSKFGIEARLNSGSTFENSVAELFTSNNYINPSLVLGNGKVDGLGELRIIIGPFSGASFEVFGSIASLDGWSMPSLIENNKTGDFFGIYANHGFDSYRYGIAFNYKYRSLAALRLCYEGAPQDIDKGYMYWRDRAKNVFNASVTVTPIEALDLTLGYELRSGRAIYNMSCVNDMFFNITYNRIDMDNVSSLNLGATYRITPQFSVWGRAENLLNSKWDIVYGIPNKGVTGLVGIGYKF